MSRRKDRVKEPLNQAPAKQHHHEANSDVSIITGSEGADHSLDRSRGPDGSRAGGGGSLSGAGGVGASSVGGGRSGGGRSALGMGAGGESVTTRSEVQGSLSQFVAVDTSKENILIRFLVHTKVWLRLLTMLLVPFAGLTVLLVFGMTSQRDKDALSDRIIKLAKLAERSLAVAHELADEETDCLWWTLDASLQSGITWDSGGLTGGGLNLKFNHTDQQIALLIALTKAIPYTGMSDYLSYLLAGTLDQINLMYDFRYDVRNFRKSIDEVTSFYDTLVDRLTSLVDFTNVMADDATIRTCQALISWARSKVALSRLRQIGGMVLLTGRYSKEFYTGLRSYDVQQTEWQQRYNIIVPTTGGLKDFANQFWASDNVREVEKLRREFLAAYVPGDNTSLPPLTFFQWWDPVTKLINDIKNYRPVITASILDSVEEENTASKAAMVGYIVLVVFAGGVSTVIALLVAWSIERPWNAMTAMRDRMHEKLLEQEQLNAIVDDFVPHDFLKLMGVKSLFELEVGNCVLKRSSVLCYAIRNFAQLSERMAPHQSFQFLNLWLATTGPVIRRHNGFVEKFHGNAVVSVFNDPNEAVDAALELLETAERRNLEDVSLQVHIGIGVHTGDIMLGTIGEQEHMHPITLSEALQVTLQTCGLTTLYQASLLVTKETFNLLNVEGLTVRFLGETAVYGLHTHPLVFEFLQTSDQGKLETLNTFQQAVKAHQDLKFDEAGPLYDLVLEINPNDIVAQRRKKLAAAREWVDPVPRTSTK